MYIILAKLRKINGLKFKFAITAISPKLASPICLAILPMICRGLISAAGRLPVKWYCHEKKIGQERSLITLEFAAADDSDLRGYFIPLDGQDPFSGASTQRIM
jgi:hypothetical protein